MILVAVLSHKSDSQEKLVLAEIEEVGTIETYIARLTLHYIVVFLRPQGSLHRYLDYKTAIYQNSIQFIIADKAY